VDPSDADIAAAQELSYRWTERQFEIGKGILRYIPEARGHGIRNTGLQAYVDADFNATTNRQQVG
jgi:oxalate decarboxylase/phosphoglucose isomerase-like protein (cupin superfamily)